MYSIRISVQRLEATLFMISKPDSINSMYISAHSSSRTVPRIKHVALTSVALTKFSIVHSLITILYNENLPLKPIVFDNHSRNSWTYNT